MRKFRFLAIGLLATSILLSCESKSGQTKVDLTNLGNSDPDSLNGFNSGGFKVKPKPSFDLQLVLKNSLPDTLKLVTCGNFVYEPFGKIDNSDALKNSLLKSFSVEEKVVKNDEMEHKTYFVKHGSSHLTLFFDQGEEADTHSYILKGEVRDGDVPFADGVKIGMQKTDFIKVFLEDFTAPDFKSCSVIELISCDEGIWHFYTFGNGKLESVKFKTDTSLPID